jgi:hypothetical protein
MSQRTPRHDSKLQPEVDADYTNLLLDVVRNSTAAGNFCQLYFLASNDDLREAMWKLAELPAKQRRMICDLIEAFGKEATLAS